MKSLKSQLAELLTKRLPIFADKQFYIKRVVPEIIGIFEDLIGESEPYDLETDVYVANYLEGRNSKVKEIKEKISK